MVALLRGEGCSPMTMMMMIMMVSGRRSRRGKRIGGACLTNGLPRARGGDRALVRNGLTVARLSQDSLAARPCHQNAPGYSVWASNEARDQPRSPPCTSPPAHPPSSVVSPLRSPAPAAVPASTLAVIRGLTRPVVMQPWRNSSALVRFGRRLTVRADGGFSRPSPKLPPFAHRQPAPRREGGLEAV